MKKKKNQDDMSGMNQSDGPTRTTKSKVSYAESKRSKEYREHFEKREKQVMRSSKTYR